jgi:S-adenosylmethionine synthetase
MTVDFVFNSGSVTPGHPDKLCDRVSDALVDGYLAEDPAARVVAECAVAGGVLFLALRSHSTAGIDVAEVARRAVADCGYRDGDFNASDCSVMINQSPLPDAVAPRFELAAMPDSAVDAISADHQVTVFGYACRQTASLMPLPVELAHRLVRALALASADLDFLMPDGQVQVGVAYRQRQAVSVNSVSLIAAQRNADAPPLDALRTTLRERVVDPVLSESGIPIDAQGSVLINPGGPLVGGGPLVHSGLTGRKTGIDSYGEFARQSGAALSGKDPLRIDRIGAYAARHAAKNLVAAELAEECEVQLSYTVGQAQPTSLRVHTYGTGTLSEAVLTERVRQAFDFRPGRIAHDFALQALPGQRGGFFEALACFGQVGREDLDLPWERLNRVSALRS